MAFLNGGCHFHDFTKFKLALAHPPANDSSLALLTPEVNPGSLYRSGRSAEEQSAGHGRRKGGLKSAPKTTHSRRPPLVHRGAAGDDHPRGLERPVLPALPPRHRQTDRGVRGAAARCLHARVGRRAGRGRLHICHGRPRLWAAARAVMLPDCTDCTIGMLPVTDAPG